MMNLKNILEADMDIFFNQDEFAIPVTVDGKEIGAIVSNSLRKDSKKLHDHMENNYSEGGKTYTIKSSDFETLKDYDPGDRVMIDDEYYKVYKVTKEGGITHIEVKIYD